MFLVPYNLIVVGVTEKQFDYKLLKTIPFMDLEKKELPSTTDEGKNKFESRNNNEPVVQIFKTSEGHILPSVHSSVAAASPIFSSYRSVFQNWKHSVPKLYKYPSSDIEVVVYRKNGEVEKLSNNASTTVKDEKQSLPPGENGAIIASSIPVDPAEAIVPTKLNTKESAMQETCETPAHPTTKENSNGVKIDEINFKSFTNHSVCENLSELTLVPLKTQQLSPSSSISYPLANATFVTTVADCIENSNHVNLSTASNEDASVLQNVAHEFDGHNNSHSNSNNRLSRNCEFIFKARLIVPSAQRLQTKSKENLTQTTTTAASPVIETESKATQISAHELYAVTRKNAENQCDIGRMEFIANFTQTDTKIPVEVVDFSQTFPVVSNAAIQTDQHENMVVSSSCQSVATKTETVERKEIFQTVEWHTTVPCCNASSQVEQDILNLSKENFCQAVPDVYSRSSQVETDDVNDLKKDVTTSTDLETNDVGIQLSASCCYFTKKKTRKQYEIKLDKLRQEIRNFYGTKENHPVQHNSSMGAGGVDIRDQVGDPSCSSWSCSSKYSESGNVETNRKTLEEATKRLDELGEEVDKLLGNATILKSNLESLEDTSYYEDELLLSN